MTFLSSFESKVPHTHCVIANLSKPVAKLAKPPSIAMVIAHFKHREEPWKSDSTGIRTSHSCLAACNAY